MDIFGITLRRSKRTEGKHRQEHMITTVKGKGHPRTGHGGPEGEQMRNSTLPSTSALDGGGRSAPRPGRFTPGKDPEPIV